MKRILLLTIIVFISFTSIYSQPVKIILDTDIDSDVDDVGAMAMLHTLANHGIIEIAGVIVTSDDKYAPLCADAINHYFKRPSIPIGVQKGIPLKEFSKYTKQISEEFPHRLKSYEDAEDAAALYKRLVESNAGSKVIIITIGHLTNFMNYLDKYGDYHAKRNESVLWSCMGGQFPEGKEANFYRPDPLSTAVCLKKWPGQVVFAGWEIGNKIITGGTFLSKSLPKGSPVRRAYELYNNFKGRPSWDQASVLYAVSQNDYWDLKRDGQCVVAPDGSNKWVTDNPNPKQAYLIEKVNPVEIAKIIDALMSGIFIENL